MTFFCWKTFENFQRDEDEILFFFSIDFDYCYIKIYMSVICNDIICAMMIFKPEPLAVYSRKLFQEECFLKNI